MGYYNEFFIEQEEGSLKHIGSSDGSDSPGYFEEVESEEDWKDALNELIENNRWWTHSDSKHPFPWQSYKTSDHLLVLRKNPNRKWWCPWRPSHEVWIDTMCFPQLSSNKQHFVKFDSSYWQRRIRVDEGEILILPELRR